MQSESGTSRLGKNSVTAQIIIMFTGKEALISSSGSNTGHSYAQGDWNIISSLGAEYYSTYCLGSICAVRLIQQPLANIYYSYYVPDIVVRSVDM